MAVIKDLNEHLKLLGLTIGDLRKRVDEYNRSLGLQSTAFKDSLEKHKALVKAEKDLTDVRQLATLAAKKETDAKDDGKKKTDALTDVLKQQGIAVLLLTGLHKACNLAIKGMNSVYVSYADGVREASRGTMGLSDSVANMHTNQKAATAAAIKIQAQTGMANDQAVKIATGFQQSLLASGQSVYQADASVKEFSSSIAASAELAGASASDISAFNNQLMTTMKQAPAAATEIDSMLADAAGKFGLHGSEAMKKVEESADFMLNVDKADRTKFIKDLLTSSGQMKKAGADFGKYTEGLTKDEGAEAMASAGMIAAANKMDIGEVLNLMQKQKMGIATVEEAAKLTKAQTNTAMMSSGQDPDEFRGRMSAWKTSSGEFDTKGKTGAALDAAMKAQADMAYLVTQIEASTATMRGHMKSGSLDHTMAGGALADSVKPDHTEVNAKPDVEQVVKEQMTAQELLTATVAKAKDAIVPWTSELENATRWAGVFAKGLEGAAGAAILVTDVFKAFKTVKAMFKGGEAVAEAGKVMSTVEKAQALARAAAAPAVEAAEALAPAAEAGGGGVMAMLGPLIVPILGITLAAAGGAMLGHWIDGMIKAREDKSGKTNNLFDTLNPFDNVAKRHGKAMEGVDAAKEMGSGRATSGLSASDKMAKIKVLEGAGLWPLTNSDLGIAEAYKLMREAANNEELITAFQSHKVAVPGASTPLSKVTKQDPDTSFVDKASASPADALPLMKQDDASLPILQQMLQMQREMVELLASRPRPVN